MRCYVLYNDFIAIYTRFKIRIYQFQMPYRCAKCSYLLPSPEQNSLSARRKPALSVGPSFRVGLQWSAKGLELLHRSQVVARDRDDTEKLQISTLTTDCAWHQLRVTPAAGEEWLSKSWSLAKIFTCLPCVPQNPAVTFPAALGDSSVQRASLESIRH